MNFKIIFNIPVHIKYILVTSFAIISLTLPFQIIAQTELERHVDYIEQNKEAIIVDTYPRSQLLIIDNVYFRYIIDIRTESCFITGPEKDYTKYQSRFVSLNEFSCKKIIKGYPEYKPLMKWL